MWEGKDDEYSSRREVDIAGCATMPYYSGLSVWMNRDGQRRRRGEISDFFCKPEACC
ncbi:MAG: hypothetical protein IGR76_19120 [Synechococcales cyanobacterium T60_A2020_003]|nr:hypothetical protein [Synechococcales cyanobacterium T60_A2020_003]